MFVFDSSGTKPITQQFIRIKPPVKFFIDYLLFCGNWWLVSAEHDKFATVKLDPENKDKLQKLKEKYSVSVSLTALANAAIKLGLPELEKKP